MISESSGGTQGPGLEPHQPIGVTLQSPHHGILAGFLPERKHLRGSSLRERRQEHSQARALFCREKEDRLEDDTRQTEFGLRMIAGGANATGIIKPIPTQPR